MLLYYQHSRFRFKSSCSLAFLRIIEHQESAEYKATAYFMHLKGYYFVEPLKWRVALWDTQFHGT